MRRMSTPPARLRVPPGARTAQRSSILVNTETTIPPRSLIGRRMKSCHIRKTTATSTHPVRKTIAYQTTAGSMASHPTRSGSYGNCWAATRPFMRSTRTTLRSNRSFAKNLRRRRGDERLP
jgi:hypothetical protein